MSVSGTFRSSKVLLAAVLLLLGHHVPVSSASPTASRSCPHPELGQSFDYVIIGGGTGGLVVANRLSADPKVKVAVIEAGTFPEDVHGNWTTVPFYQSKLVDSKDPMMWDFTMVPQPEVSNTTFPYYRAKALGGCSSVNAMAYTHTCKGCHQLWADEVGDRSYTYENMKKFYHKSMDFTPPNPKDRFPNVTLMFDKADTVTGGVLAVTYAHYVQSWATWLSLGLEAIGVRKANSFINGNLIGQAYNMDTIDPKTSLRSAASSRYLRPVLNRTNLAVFDKTMAQRIIFYGTKATGVVIGNGNCTLTAKKEVILSAGAIQSPQMLLVSGVGPANLLRSLNIPVVANRPGVGQNLQDQYATFVTYQVNTLTGSELQHSPSYLASAIDQFNANASGPLASPGGDLYSTERIPSPLASSWSAEINTSLAQFPSDWPHVGYAAFPSLGRGPAAVAIDPKGNYASVLLNLQQISSTGYVSIASANMSDPPIIDPKMLTHPADIQLLVAAIKRMRAAFSAPAMQPVLIGSEVLPGANVQTDDEIIAYLRKNTYSMSHAFATNKMGKPTDPLAVVDSHGKVLRNLSVRVIDGSAFPFLPPGPSPQAQVYMLAEKLSQDILSGH